MEDKEKAGEGHRRSGGKGSARRIAGAAADLAIGGGALAADKAIEVIEDAVERTSEVVEGVREKTAEITGQRVRSPRSARESDSRRFEDRTRDDLYQLAAERGIAGRSAMRKDELIAALRDRR